MTTAIFTGGLRTPFGRAFKGAYKDTRADDLLVELLAAQVARFPDRIAAGVDDLLVGCAYPKGEQDFNVARMTGLGADLPIPAATVNRLCASSLEVVSMAAAQVKSGWGDLYLVAGLEAMSRVPRRGDDFTESERIKSVAPEAYVSMGNTAENVAEKYPHITRQHQEELAARSHELAFQAYERGDYSDQIHPYLIERDEFIRFPVNQEKIASLKPAFKEDGVVTAATSSPLTDGATSGWVMSADRAQQFGVKNGLEIVDCVAAHVEPEVMGMGPVPATRKLLDRNQLSVDDIAAFEVNEAFAIQVLASAEELGMPLERVNAWGGAMALGHPLGASGLRLMMTLHDRLAQAGEANAFGVATLCVGGGQGMSILGRWVTL